jgi:hypothetical protein
MNIVIIDNRLQIGAYPRKSTITPINAPDNAEIHAAHETQTGQLSMIFTNTAPDEFNWLNANPVIRKNNTYSTYRRINTSKISKYVNTNIV